MRADQRSHESATWRKLYKAKRWRDLRAARLAVDPFCRRALHGKRLILATVVNHKIPHKGDETLFFDPENLEAVCKPCHHGVIQRAERRGFSSEVDASGYPTDPHHPANQPRRC